MVERLRVAAYAVCRRGGDILLARYVSPFDAGRHWTLPGGGIEHAEDPYDAVVREVAEETGYDVAVDRLLGVDSRSRISHDGAELHSIGIYYEVHVTGGRLRNELGGSTDLAAWTPLADVPTLERAVIIDTALELDRTRPPTGHPTPAPHHHLLHR